MNRTIYRVRAFSARDPHPLSCKEYVAAHETDAARAVAFGDAEDEVQRSRTASNVASVELDVWIPSIRCWKQMRLDYVTGIGTWVRGDYSHPIQGGPFNGCHPIITFE
jgi:hypothetical protein